jgi:hypothetical protein
MTAWQAGARVARRRRVLVDRRHKPAGSRAGSRAGLSVAQLCHTRYVARPTRPTGGSMSVERLSSDLTLHERPGESPR